MRDTAWPTTIKPAPTPRKGHNMKYKLSSLCGRSRDSVWRRHRGRAFLQSIEVDQETDASQELAANSVEEKGVTLAVAGAAAGAHHAEDALHPLQDPGRLRCFASRQRQPANQIQLPEMGYDRGTSQR